MVKHPATTNDPSGDNDHVDNEHVDVDGHVPDVVPLLRGERAALIELLEGLDTDQWSAPTDCPAWSVQGIALHLLGDDLALLARQRDSGVSGLIVYAEDHPGISFRELLDGFNEQWVTASRFLSGPLLIELLRLSGQWTADYYETVDSEQLGEAVGMFGVTDASPYWQIIAREYVERWAHHHQIRRALGKPDLGEEFLRGAADVIVTSLAPAMAGIDAGDGAQIGIEITSIGSWTYERRHGRWVVQPGHPESADGLLLRLDQRHATTVLSRGLDSSNVWEPFQSSGDSRLADAMKQLLSQILARP